MNSELKSEWRTFNGKMVSFSTIDHQHLSNVYYHWKYASPIIQGANFDKDTQTEIFRFVQKELDDRFNGQLLPYRPHAKFTMEIEALKKAGMVHGNSIITFEYNQQGTTIGEIVVMPESKHL